MVMGRWAAKEGEAWGRCGKECCHRSRAAMLLSVQRTQTGMEETGRGSGSPLPGLLPQPGVSTTQSGSV